MPLPASPCLFAASASPVPRSPSSAWFSLLFPRLRRLQLRLRRLLRWPWARAHVGAIFRLLGLARTGAGCAHSARRGGGAGDPGFSRTAMLRGRRQWQPTPVPLPGKSHGRRSLVGCSSWGLEESDRLSDFTFTFHFQALEKGMATHSSVLAWRIPGTGEPGGLPSIRGRTESDTTEAT